MPVQKFRTRIVEIEAMRFVGTNVQEIADWSVGNFRDAVLADDGANAIEFTGRVYDHLHDAWIPVKSGQWIVRGAKGEFYPCDDETFHWKYEEIKDPDFTMSGTLEYRDGEVTAEGFEFKAGTHNIDDEPVRFEG